MIESIRGTALVATALVAGPVLMAAALAQQPASSTKRPSEGPMSLEKTPFGKLPDGHEASLFTCTNRHGTVLKLTDYGAIVVAVEVPDRSGRLANVTLGFAALDGYLQRHPYFGATVGRYCNRIAKGEFTLDGQTYVLATNNEPNHLHGGDKGFDRYLWEAEERHLEDGVGVRFSRLSRAGEEGYPGNLRVTAEYILTDRNELRVEFTATTDAATPVNLTNHCYWNLGGAGAGPVLDHELTIAADQYLPVDDGLIPTGELADVETTPLDFRRPRRIGQEIGKLSGDPSGYDHCFALRSQDGTLAWAARAKDPVSGRVMEILTTQPGLQFYTGNFLDGTPASGGFDKHHAFCLETQHFPDSPNQEAFPSTILHPGETFKQVTLYRFSAE